MGRYDFRPLRVHQTATQLLQNERISNVPPWYDVIGAIPPSQPLIRTQPFPHERTNKQPRTKKASRLFKPQKITYEEDKLRRDFYGDHPWELARPRMIIEDDGKDSYKTNWKDIRQPEKALSGERYVLFVLTKEATESRSVIQRQMWLQRNIPNITKARAYDQARKEFYKLRLVEDTERRVAREEALHVGARFGPSAMEIGMQLENEEYERWKVWAEKQVELQQQRQAALYSGTDSRDSPAEELAAPEESLESIPG